jgi:uncharacterized damage-inducible protein DinB
MAISDLLLKEFDEEVQKTRSMLERVPAANTDFAPHAKSMTFGRLASHVAELGGFGLGVVTKPGVDFSTGEYKPLPFESGAQLVSAFNEGAGKVRAALKDVSDAAWSENWTLSYAGKTLFQGSRFLAYRQMFMNHVVHHRAQLGVYLRMNDIPLPPTYGPSADDTLGF